MTAEMMYLVLAGLGVLILLLVVMGILRMSRSRKLRQQFGPEYEETVRAAGHKSVAERDLEDRRRMMKKVDVRELDPAERQAFAERWRALQIEFVDRPRHAVEGADKLVTEVMRAKNYPEGDFEKRLAAASVTHPTVVSDYRDARLVADRTRAGEATTEEMRRSLVCYRNLFQELLGVDEVPATELRQAGPPVAPPRETRR